MHWKNNIDVKRQKNQLASIQAQKLNAKAQYLPSVGIQGRGSRNDGQQIDPISGNGTNIISDNFFKLNKCRLFIIQRVFKME